MFPSACCPKSTTRPWFAFDPDAVAYFVAQGITDTATKIAFNTCVVGLKADGDWGKLGFWWPMIQGSLSSNLINAITPGSNTLSIVGGVTSDSKGLTPDGATGYVRTNTNCSNFDASNFSVGFYSQATSLDGNGYDCQTLAGDFSNAFSFSSPRTLGDVQEQVFNGTNNVSEIGTSGGFKVIARTGNTGVNVFYYQRGALLGSGLATLDTAGLTTLDPVLFAQRIGAAIFAQPTTRGVSGLYFGTYTDAAAAARVTARMETLQVSLARNT